MLGDFVGQSSQPFNHYEPEPKEPQEMSTGSYTFWVPESEERDGEAKR